MKLKKLLAAVTTGVLAVTSLSLSGLVSSAEVQELMNDTFESGYGAWKGVGSSLSLSTEQSHSGGTSLYCYDRTASWGAPRCSLTGIVAGRSELRDLCQRHVRGQRSAEHGDQDDLHRCQRHRSLRPGCRCTGNCRTVGGDEGQLHRSQRCYRYDPLCGDAQCRHRPDLLY